MPWHQVKQAAFDLRGFLEAMNLRSIVLATGGKGLHVGRADRTAVHVAKAQGFSHDFAKRSAGENFRAFTTSPAPARKRRIYIDYLRNRPGATFIAPLLDPREAPLRTRFPFAWDELGPAFRGGLRHPPAPARPGWTAVRGKSYTA